MARPQLKMSEAGAEARALLMDQDVWWVPLGGWADYRAAVSSGCALDEALAATGQGKVRVAHMDASWRHNAANLLERTQEDLFHAWCRLRAARLADEIDDEPDTGGTDDASTWMVNSRLYKALRA